MLGREREVGERGQSSISSEAHALGRRSAPPESSRQGQQHLRTDKGQVEGEDVSCQMACSQLQEDWGNEYDGSREAGLGLLRARLFCAGVGVACVGSLPSSSSSLNPLPLFLFLVPTPSLYSLKDARSHCCRRRPRCLRRCCPVGPHCRASSSPICFHSRHPCHPCPTPLPKPLALLLLLSLAASTYLSCSSETRTDCAIFAGSLFSLAFRTPPEPLVRRFTSLLKPDAPPRLLGQSPLTLLPLSPTLLLSSTTVFCQPTLLVRLLFSLTSDGPLQASFGGTLLLLTAPS